MSHDLLYTGFIPFSLMCEPCIALLSNELAMITLSTQRLAIREHSQTQLLQTNLYFNKSSVVQKTTANFRQSSEQFL